MNRAKRAERAKSPRSNPAAGYAQHRALRSASSSEKEGRRGVRFYFRVSEINRDCAPDKFLDRFHVCSGLIGIFSA